ncbi:hypothetical protein [Mycolicibacterium peregrinum]|uniref:hypothetical protein n=1 Tax=Mycolicibacterium peregrinum TaxID=43304 RepID=UPI001F42E910|nr:hypothetical protein [Mycolicibacterium peregrinum]
MVLAIALAVVITVLVVKPGSDENRPSNAGGAGSKSEFASANDTGPVNIITEDPTCEAWNTVLSKYSEVTTSVKWDDRDISIPASSWTSEQRATYETVGKAMTLAADQTASLAKTTPHRVMRVLYEQFIAYTRTFVERLPSYGVDDDNFAAASNAAGASVAKICGAITYRVAQAIAPLVPPVPGPTKAMLPQASSEATMLFTERNPVCSDWDSLVSKLNEDTQSWRAIDKGIPAKDWTPEQRSINEAAAPILLANADEMERLGRQSGNPELEDITVLAAQYRRAFVKTLSDYKAADSYLEAPVVSLVRLVNSACKASS